MTSHDARQFLFLVPLALIVLTIGCAEDRKHGADMVGPAGPDPVVYDLSTPLGAAEGLRDALGTRDTVAMDSVLAADATWILEPGDRARLGWPVETLTPEELRRALAHLFSGEQFSYGNVPLAGVDSVEVSAWSLVRSFADAPSGSPWPDSQQGEFDVAVTLHGDGYALDPASTGQLIIYVRADSSATPPAYRVVGVQDATGIDPEPGTVAPSLSYQLVAYLANHDPVAALSVSPASGPIQSVFHLDSSASHDADMDTLTRRWRIGDVDTPWTSWVSVATLDTIVEHPGTFEVAVEVRDHWHASGVEFATITVSP